MKICFLSHTGHPNPRRWIEYFAAQPEHEVHVIAVTDRSHPVPGAVMHDVMLPIDRKWSYALSVWKIRRLVREISPDLLIAYRVQSNGFLAALTGWSPLVMAAQDETIVVPEDSKVLRFCAGLAVRRADGVNAWGEHMAANLRALGADAARIVVRPRGVRTDIFVPDADAEPGARRGQVRPTICTTRGLYPIYRYDLLMEVMSRVVQELPEAKLYVLGQGPSEAELRADIQARGLSDNVELLGQCEQRHVAEILRTSHAYVSVNSTEGVSSSLHEAMACGAFPVVADIAPNRPWIEHGVNGFLGADGNASGYTSLLLRALRDEPLRLAAARRNVAYVRENLCWDRNMQTMLSEYEAVVSAHGRRGVAKPVGLLRAAAQSFGLAMRAANWRGDSAAR